MGDVINHKFSDDYTRQHFENNNFKTVSGDPYRVFKPEHLKRTWGLSKAAPLNNIEENMAHEMEYESEDHDY